MRRLFRSLILIYLIVGCSTPKEKIPPTDTMQKPPGKIVIYQLLTRLFGNKTTLNKPYGTIEQNGVGKFNDIDDTALAAIKQLGVTHVWFTGVLEHAVLTDYTQYGIPLDDADVVKGRAGSPYSIKDYYDVNPDLAVNVPDRMKEFEQLVERTHQQGLKVIVDFVPNHVARRYKSDAKPAGVKDFGEDDDDSVSFRPGNNFYYLPGTSFKVPRGYNPLGPYSFPTKDGKFDETPAKVTGNTVFDPQPDVNDWFEAVKLNYGVDIQNGNRTYFDPVPDTWLKMKDILSFWAAKHVDAFRCDMAEMIPVEFWNWVIPQVKQVNPDIVFIAEIYNPDQYRNYLQTGKFDFLYDKVLLYDTLRLLVNGQRSTADIFEIQRRLAGINHNMLHFLENHDEQRIASKYFAGDPWKAVPAMVISSTIDQGPVMIFFGQEVGEPGLGSEGFSGDDGRTTHFDYWGVPEHQKWMNGGMFDGGLLSAEQKQLRQFYGDLLSFVAKSPAVTQGTYRDLTSFNIDKGNIDDKIHVFMRFTDNEKLLIVSGFNDKDQTVRISIPQDVAVEANMISSESYIARDILWREVEVGFDKDLSFQLKLKPYTGLILKIK